MTQYCDFHPRQPAHWHCPNCHGRVCADCAPEAAMLKGENACPICRHSLCTIKKSTHARPFWQQMPALLRSSLNGQSMWVILLCSGIAGGFLGPMWLQVLSAVLIVAVTLATACAWAFHNATPSTLHGPSFAKVWQLCSAFEMRVMGLLVLLPLMAVMASYHYASAAVSFLLFVLCLLVVPVLQLQVVMSRSSSLALNLNSFVRLFGLLEKSYLVLVANTFALLVMGIVVWDFSYRHLPTAYAGSIAIAGEVYLALVYASILAALRGQLKEQQAYQGNPVIQLPGRADKVEAEINVALKLGRYEHVYVLLERELRAASCPDYRREQLYRLTLAAKDERRLEIHSQTFMRMLLARGRDGEALDLLRRLRRSNAGYRLYDSSLAVRLATAANKQHHYKQVLWLAQEAHTRYDELDRVAQLYLLAAQVLISQFQEYKKAAAYLRYIDAHCESQLSSPCRSDSTETSIADERQRLQQSITDSSGA